MFSSSLLSIGIMMELSGFNTHILLSGRLIAGLGTGLMTNAIPLYQSEIAPSDIRGRLVSMYTSLSSFGRLVGYVVIFYSSYFQSNWAWRTPWAVQFILSIAFLAACSLLPYSPRWLISQKRDAEGLEVLGNIYDLPKDHRIVQDEYTKIVSQIEAEHRMGSNQTYAELFRGSNLKTTLTAFFISIATCFTGNVAISYFAPTIFKNAGLDDVSISLALTGGASLLSFIANMISFKWWVDTWGRRSLFLIGSAISSICMFTVGIIFYTYAEVTNGEVAIPNAQARYIVILCIYFFSASFAATWEICTYVYTAEVFNMKYRAKGLSLTYAISWAGSILITYTIPYLLLYSISGVYFFFGACSILNFIGVWFIPETKGKSLEEIDAMFE
ncbi:hypothetical protein RMCBS344292_09585 [Rhizopus microsporus]|nr:hypothetical protein RMCBS344292_09585 [Rhizopus microsporus]